MLLVKAAHSGNGRAHRAVSVSWTDEVLAKCNTYEMKGELTEVIIVIVLDTGMSRLTKDQSLTYNEIGINI